MSVGVYTVHILFKDAHNTDMTVQHTHTHTRLTALCPGLPGWASTRKVKKTGFY